ncbi:hypothetical protein VCHC06A1_0661, partial [Vibrio cholerae HC-06A1]|jgi:hypothetical protein
MKNK